MPKGQEHFQRGEGCLLCKGKVLKALKLPPKLMLYLSNPWEEEENVTGPCGFKNSLFCQWGRGNERRLSHRPRGLGKRLVPRVVIWLEGEKEIHFRSLLSGGR